MPLSSYRIHRIYIAAAMNYGLGSVNPEEVAYYSQFKKQINDMKKKSVKIGIPTSWDKQNKTIWYTLQLFIPMVLT